MPFPPAPDEDRDAPRPRGLQLRRAACAPPKPRPNVVDQLERLTTRFDELTHRARLATTADDFNDLEEEANILGRDLRAVFRSPTPRAVPLYVTPCGNGALF